MIDGVKNCLEEKPRRRWTIIERLEDLNDRDSRIRWWRVRRRDREERAQLQNWFGQRNGVSIHMLAIGTRCVVFDNRTGRDCTVECTGCNARAEGQHGEQDDQVQPGNPNRSQPGSHPVLSQGI
jgi:hypothetical protein